MSASTIITCSRVRKDFPGKANALPETSFNLNENDLCVLQGKNGSGKSTSLKILVGLVSATTGKVELFGETSKPGQTEALRKTGYIPAHESSLSPNASVYEDLYFFARAYQVAKPVKKLIDQAIELFDLQDYRHTQMQNLSTGYKKRALLAKALVHQPKLILLDEPFASVDKESVPVLIEKLQSYLYEHKAACLMSSHNTVLLENESAMRLSPGDN